MYLILSYIKYWLLRSEAHAIHAPFLFHLYTTVFRREKQTDHAIETLRRQLAKNKTSIRLQDFGAGSLTHKKKSRSIESITKLVSTPSKFSILLRDLIDHLEYKKVIELGTSLGLNTLYLSTNPKTQVATFEGDPTLCSLAQENFKRLNRKNISLIEGNIDQTLPEYFELHKDIDLIYIDANHKFKPTLNYFELCLSNMSKNGVIVFDDIHWSKEMNEAWQAIKDHPQAQLTVDVFEAGFVFLNPQIQKGEYILSF